jgi:hypothetical protein
MTRSRRKPAWFKGRWRGMVQTAVAHATKGGPSWSLGLWRMRDRLEAALQLDMRRAVGRDPDRSIASALPKNTVR